MKELAYLILGFVLVAGPSLIACIKLWERFSWLEGRFDEHQEKLRNIGSFVIDVRERLWGEQEEELKRIGISHPNDGARRQPNYRKWDL